MLPTVQTVTVNKWILPLKPFHISAVGGTCLRAIRIATFSSATPDVRSTGGAWIQVTIQGFPPVPPRPCLIDARSRQHEIRPISPRGSANQGADRHRRFR